MGASERFDRYMAYLAQGLGHADQHAGFKGYCTGLILPLAHKSVDPAMEEAMYGTPMFRQFASLDMGEDNLPDESTILCFRHLLEVHNPSVQILATVNATLKAKGLMLKQNTAIDATLIAAPSSTNHSGGECDPEMHQTQIGNQWHFGMKAHIGVDANSGLVHTVPATAANEHDITQAHELLHGGEETDVHIDAGYRGVLKREEIQEREHQPNWYVVMMPCKRRELDKDTAMGAILEKLEQTKTRIRAKVEHPFRVIKRQFGYVKFKYRGLAKNTANLMMFALSNLWLVRKALMKLQEARG